MNKERNYDNLALYFNEKVVSVEECEEHNEIVIFYEKHDDVAETGSIDVIIIPKSILRDYEIDFPEKNNGKVIK